MTSSACTCVADVETIEIRVHGRREIERVFTNYTPIVIDPTCPYHTKDQT